jgi:hypothetical protein
MQLSSIKVIFSRARNVKRVQDPSFAVMDIDGLYDTLNIGESHAFVKQKAMNLERPC